MRIIDPKMSAGFQAEKKAVAKHRRTKNRKAHIETAQAYLNAIHDFRLTIGGAPTETVKRMTGREAKSLNEAMRSTWVAAVMENPDTEMRLSHWTKEGTP